MAKAEQKPEEFTCDVVKEFYSKEAGQKARLILRVVKWSRGKTRTLEYRWFYQRADGSLRAQKMSGIDSDVWKVMMANREEITKLLQGAEK